MKLIVLIFLFALAGLAAAAECEKKCTFIYKPVCCSDGQVYKTFNNDCEYRNFICPRADKSAWDIKYVGRCAGDA